MKIGILSLRITALASCNYPRPEKPNVVLILADGMKASFPFLNPYCSSNNPHKEVAYKVTN